MRRFGLSAGGDEKTKEQIPTYGLVPEASKLNLNTVTIDMLEMLPRMTHQLAANILSWRDTNTEAQLITSTNGNSVYGAKSDVYGRLNPAYSSKNDKYESLEELRLIQGMTDEIAFGEDSNMNGILDFNENDGRISLPYDNQDGKLDPGIFEYLTVYSNEPNVQTNGSARIYLNSTNTQDLVTKLTELFDQTKANQVVSSITPSVGRITSTLEFYYLSGLSSTEFAQIENSLSATNSTNLVGFGQCDHRASGGAGMHSGHWHGLCRSIGCLPAGKNRNRRVSISCLGHPGFGPHQCRSSRSLFNQPCLSV